MGNSTVLKERVNEEVKYKEIENILENKKINLILKRLFDVVVSFIGIAFLLPVFLIIGTIIKVTSNGPVFFKQIRVGKGEKEFKILKFRTMVQNAEQLGMQITVGNDPRITGIGHFLRKTKLDELPQLINVLKGEMSFVGPRPEVPKYVRMYTQEQKIILKIRPGITDLASIEYRDENEVLDKVDNPEEYYIRIIMQDKLNLNLVYIKKINVIKDIKIILKTILKCFK